MSTSTTHPHTLATPVPLRLTEQRALLSTSASIEQRATPWPAAAARLPVSHRDTPFAFHISNDHRVVSPFFFSVYHIHSEVWAFHKLHLTTVRVSKTAIDCDEMFTYTSMKYFCALKTDFFPRLSLVTWSHLFVVVVVVEVLQSSSQVLRLFPPNPLVQ